MAQAQTPTVTQLRAGAVPRLAVLCQCDPQRPQPRRPIGPNACR
jgi:hypothetical protein